jgi:hypothetical protein
MKRPESRRQDRSTGNSASTRATTQTPGAPKRVELHIEELVLNGFDPSECLPIGDALEHELTRLLAHHSAWSSVSTSVEIVNLHGGAFRVHPGARQTNVGIGIARAVHSAISTTPVVNRAHGLGPRIRGKAPCQGVSQGRTF